MLKKQRHKLILEKIDEKDIVKVQELMDLTDTSESTIRRDLDHLEKLNELSRIHGGAISNRNIHDESISVKTNQNPLEKEKIAKYAASLVKNMDSIFLDAGSTTFRMIKHLSKKDIIVITNGISHIDELIKNNITTYLIGGKIKSKTSAIVGGKALKSLENYNFDKSFLGTNSISISKGVTTPDPEEAIIKETIIKKSKISYVLADDSKFDKVSFATFANFKDCTILTNNIKNNKYKKIDTIKEV